MCMPNSSQRVFLQPPRQPWLRNLLDITQIAMGIRYKAPLAITRLPLVQRHCAGTGHIVSAKVEGVHAAISAELLGGCKWNPCPDREVINDSYVNAIGYRLMVLRQVCQTTLIFS